MAPGQPCLFIKNYLIVLDQLDHHWFCIVLFLQSTVSLQQTGQHIGAVAILAILSCH